MYRYACGLIIAGMQNRNLRTAFWRNAAASLPAEVRDRYMLDLERAERWELALARAIEVLARVKAALARTFQAPRSAH
ncbi:MAG TPA: hypothetical protein VF211_05995 [Burkholderiales bacterium]